MDKSRQLLVVADDYGMGPATSRGILDLGLEGHLSAAVLIVNTDTAGDAVRAWDRAGRPMELGWHPNLTLDRPLLPASRVPSLVDPAGGFWGLNTFISRVTLGRIDPADVYAELAAQHRLFVEFVGHPPRVVNSHQHVQVFHPVGDALIRVLRDRQPDRPYVRRVREPWGMLAAIPGALVKRTMLTVLGRLHARRLATGGLPGNDWLVGVTNPECVHDPDFLVRWVRKVPGRRVELACHPGYHDPSLIGRDCPEEHLSRRVREYDLLRHPGFAEACREVGLGRVGVHHLLGPRPRSARHAA